MVKPTIPGSRRAERGEILPIGGKYLYPVIHTIKNIDLSFGTNGNITRVKKAGLDIKKVTGGYDRQI
jgi:hypothetical protein